MTAGLKQIAIIRPNPWTNPVRVHYALYRDDTVWCGVYSCCVERSERRRNSSARCSAPRRHCQRPGELATSPQGCHQRVGYAIDWDNVCLGLPTSVVAFMAICVIF